MNICSLSTRQIFQIQKKSTMLLYICLWLLQIDTLQILCRQKEQKDTNQWHSDEFGICRWFLLYPFFLITSSWIRTVQNSVACSYSTVKIFPRDWIYNNCYCITAYCLVFKTSHLSLCALMYSIRYNSYCGIPMVYAIFFFFFWKSILKIN